MDLFSQLDKAESELTGTQVVMVRYRTRFHRDIVYSNLSTNPAVSQKDVATAVAINDPEKFLPQPWPPLALSDSASIMLVSLIKMRSSVNVGLHLPEAHSALLATLISYRFPARALIPTTTSAITSCEARITQDGAVTLSFSFPDTPPSFSQDTSTYLSNELKYVKAMLILGMQQYLESLT